MVDLETSPASDARVHIVRKRKDVAGNSNLETEAGTSRLNCDLMPTPHQLVLHNTSVLSIVQAYIPDSEAVHDFEKVKCFDDFKIFVNGEILNSKLPEPPVMKYYELCSDQRQFLHRKIKRLNGDLVVGMILQTVTTVAAMKAANISTFHTLECQGKNLKSFEDLGLEVGFLRTTLDKLVKLSRDHQVLSASKSVKLAEVEEQEKALSEEVPKLEELMKSVADRKLLVEYLGGQVETLEEESKQLDQAFKEVSDSTW